MIQSKFAVASDVWKENGNHAGQYKNDEDENVSSRVAVSEILAHTPAFVNGQDLLDREDKTYDRGHQYDEVYPDALHKGHVQLFPIVQAIQGHEHADNQPA
jgi:hypothetical protein